MRALRLGAALLLLATLLAPLGSATTADAAVGIAWYPIPPTHGTYTVAAAVTEAGQWRLVSQVGAFARDTSFASTGPDTAAHVYVNFPCALGDSVTAILYQWSGGAWQPHADATFPCVGL